MPIADLISEIEKIGPWKLDIGITYESNYLASRVNLIDFAIRLLRVDGAA